MPLCPISIVNSKTEIISSRSLSSSPRFSSSYLLLQKMSLFLLFHSFLFLFVFSFVLFIMMITNMIIIIILIIIIIAMIIQTAAVRFSLLGCHPPLVLSLFSLLYTNIYIFCQRKKKNAQIQICLVLVLSIGGVVVLGFSPFVFNSRSHHRIRSTNLNRLQRIRDQC